MSKTIDFFGGLLLLALSFMLYFKFIPEQIPNVTNENGMSPAFFPEMGTILLFVLSLLLIAKSYKGLLMYHNLRQGSLISKQVLKVTLIIFLLFGYVLLLQQVGFLIATPVFLVIFFVYLGVRNLKTLLVLTVVTPIFIYIVFEKLLLVFLPQGRLFS